MLRRILIAVFLVAGVASAAVSPADWIPLRWEGGALEQARRAGAETPPSAEALSAIGGWYDAETASLLDGTPYNCILITWSGGWSAEDEASHRERIASYARTLQDRGFAVLGLVPPGPGWEAAVADAGRLGLDGAVLDGEFAAEAPGRALALIREHNGSAVIVPLLNWSRVDRDQEFPILAVGGDILWPGMLSPSEASGWGAGPTSNPWVISDAWRIEAARAGDSRPVWSAALPKRLRDQPLGENDFRRAVADAGMAGGRWIVALDDDWRLGLSRKDADALQRWRTVAEDVAFFEKRRAEFADFRVLPSAVVVHDPNGPSGFANSDVLNMLAVRHVPHRVILREDFPKFPLGDQTPILAFDSPPPNEAEHDVLQAFTNGGGTLLVGPEWTMAQFKAGDAWQRVIAGRGTIRAYPGEVVSDKFSRDVAGAVQDGHVAPKLYNVGSIISRISRSGERLLIELTEYGDYPTENVTVHLAKKYSKAVLHYMDGYTEELEIYDEGGETEIVIPEVPVYCAVLLE